MTNQTPESVIAEVIEYHADAIGSHWDGCHKHHAPCLAVKLRDMLREPGVPDAATEELARIKPLFENLSREYPNECNKRVKAEAERDAATAAITRAQAIHRETGAGGDCAVCNGWGWPCPTVAALDGAPEPEGRWEYRGRLQSCGYVAEGYISAEHALNGLRVEIEDHPFLVMDDTAIVERARVREWLPVEGESK